MSIKKKKLASVEPRASLAGLNLSAGYQKEFMKLRIYKFMSTCEEFLN